MKQRNLGDTVLWTSAIEAVHNRYPEAGISLAVPKDYADLFLEDPRISKLIALPKERRQLWNTARELKNERFDAVLCFHASPTTRGFVRRVSATTTLIHHHSRRRTVYGSDVPIVGLGQPASAQRRDLNVVKSFGWEGEDPPTKIYTSANIKRSLIEKFKERGLNLENPFLVFSPGASRPSKRWPLERYRKLVLEFHKEIPIVFLVEPRLSLLPEEKEFFSRMAYLYSTYSLQELAALLSMAKVYFGSDSGLKHLAAAVGTQTLTLFGPESVGEWHGYSTERHPYLQIPVACRQQDPQPPEYAWCGANLCPLSSHACMSLLTVEKVATELRKLILCSVRS